MTNIPNIGELKERINSQTLVMVLLCLATLGIYQLMWLTKHNETIVKVTNTKVVSNVYLIWVAVCFAWFGLFYLSISGSIEEIEYDEAVQGALFIALCLLVAFETLLIVWAFKAKRVLQEYALRNFKVDLQMNAFYLFIFHIYYINFCINDLPESLRKHEIISGDMRPPQ